MPPEEEDPLGLARAFAEMARRLLAEETLEQTLGKIVQLAVQTVDGCRHAGISLVQGRRITTSAASDDVPRRLDAIQYETDEGPCLDAIREHEVVEVGCLAEEERWPRFSLRAAGETGINSILAYRLFVKEDTLGALNLYSKQADAFTDNDAARQVGAVFAAHAAVALSHAQQQEHMAKALETRDVIGQAKGILMAREHLTAEQAFDLLRRASQRLNVKLREVAEEVTRTGAVPEQEPA